MTTIKPSEYDIVYIRQQKDGRKKNKSWKGNELLSDLLDRYMANQKYYNPANEKESKEKIIVAKVREELRRKKSRFLEYDRTSQEMVNCRELLEDEALKKISSAYNSKLSRRRKKEEKQLSNNNNEVLKPPPQPLATDANVIMMNNNPLDALKTLDPKLILETLQSVLEALVSDDLPSDHQQQQQHTNLQSLSEMVEEIKARRFVAKQHLAAFLSNKSSTTITDDAPDVDKLMEYFSDDPNYDPLNIFFADQPPVTTTGDDGKTKKKQSRRRDEGVTVSETVEELNTLVSRDRGDEIAKSFLTIKEVVDKLTSSSSSSSNCDDDVIIGIILSTSNEEMKEAIRRLMKCKPNKRARRQGSSSATSTTTTRPSSSSSRRSSARAKDDEDHDMESVITGVSTISINTDFLGGLDVVSRMVIGDKIYSGTTKGKVPHGVGFMTYRSSNKWMCGHWKEGNLHGFATRTYDDKNDENLDKHGRRKENGHKSIGMFVKNGLHGKAAYITNESSFLGKFKLNKRHGKGYLQHNIEGTFDGIFSDNVFDGTHVPRGRNRTGKKVKNMNVP